MLTLKLAAAASPVPPARVVGHLVVLEFQRVHVRHHSRVAIERAARSVVARGCGVPCSNRFVVWVPDPNGPHTVYNAWDGGMADVDVYMFPCFSCGNPGGQVASLIAYLQSYNITNRSPYGPRTCCSGCAGTAD